MNLIKRINEDLNKTAMEQLGENDDPSAINTGGVKYDGGKIPVFRGAIGYFPRAIRSVAAVSDFGARKYAWNGWQSVDDGINRYTDGLARHLLAECTDGPRDDDSGLLHAEHAAWNALARLELMLVEKEDDDGQTTAA